MFTCSIHPKASRVYAVCAAGTARLVRDEGEPDGEQCSQMLSASQGNILDDEDLINTLAVSKVSLFPELLLGTEALSTMPAGKHFAVRLCVCCTFSIEM